MTNKQDKAQSQFNRVTMQLKKNKLAMASLFIIISFYALSLFADFIAPYSYDNEDRDYSYCPPTQIKFKTTREKLTWPYVNGVYSGNNQYHQKIYRADKKKVYPLRFFVRADSYKILGVVPFNIHLFGVKPPARIYLWGADSRGRDLFSRIIHGGRISLSIGLIGVFISLLIGLLVGGISGYYGGKIDNIIMRSCEMVMMIPGFYLMLALRAAFPPSLSSVQVYLLIVFIFSFIGWAGMARVIRGLSISLREREYVLAAKSLGLSDIYIIIKHILPHTLSYSIIAATLSIPGYILGESGLSFIGLGIQDPVPSWGNLLTEAAGIAQIKFHPWILLPGLFILITVMTFNILGDALRDAYDPMLKKGQGR